MSFTEEQLNDIYDRSSGYCHICHMKLAFRNYGRFGAKGAWEVEHSKPKSCGGTNRRNNLYAACIPCNRGKSNGSTRTARAAYGNTRAPLSVEARRKARAANAFAGGVLGAIAGLIFGPGGAILGAGLGARLGYKQNPDND